MDSVTFLWAAFAVSIAGFAWLALAMDSHWKQVHGKEQTSGRRRMLRIVGACSLAASLGLCLVADPASMAVLEWAMLLAAAAVLVALVLHARPRALRWLCPI